MRQLEQAHGAHAVPIAAGGLVREVRQSFFAPGPFPGMNEMIAAAKSGRGKGNAYSRQKALWTAVVARHAKSRKVGPFAAPVFVTCVWYEANARRDPDNVHAAIKFVLDGLVAAKAIPGDGRTWIAGVEHSVRTGPNPGVLVTVSTAPEDHEVPVDIAGS